MTGRIDGRRVVVASVIASGDTEEDACAIQGGERLAFGDREAEASVAHVHHADVDPAILHHQHVIERFKFIGQRDQVGGADRAHGHELDGPVEARDSDSVLRSCADDSRDERAVVEAICSLIEGIGVVAPGIIGGVDSVNVVHLAVAVVVDAVAGNLARIPPHVRGEILVTVVDPGVDHRHDDVGASGGDLPGCRSAHFCQRPLACPQRIVASRRGDRRARRGGDEWREFRKRLDFVVRLHGKDIRITTQLFDGFLLAAAI